MTLLTTWPVILDDPGPGLTGTVLDASILGVGAGGATMKAAIEALLHSATNPTVTPADIINEMVTARGSKASLDGRLDICLNDDGTLKPQASLVTQLQAQSILGQSNMVGNDTFRLRSRGDILAPDYWALSGTGASIVACGTGGADTKRKVGDFCEKVTYGSASAKLTQKLLSAAGFSRADFLKGVTVGFGAWIYASSANVGRMVVDDGATQTATAYHTGSSAWEWVALTHIISNSATFLNIYFEVAATGSAYVSGPTCLVSLLAPTGWIPCQLLSTGTLLFPTGAGDVSVGTKKFVFVPARPGIVTDVQLAAEVAPTGAALIVDVNTHSGNSLAGAAAPTVAVGAAGVLTGAYYYKITFIDADGNENVLGTASAVVNPAAQQVNMSNIPVGGGTTAKRSIWRTKAGGSVYYRVDTINDNTTTTYVDNIADASITELGTTLPYVSMFTVKPTLAIGAYDANAVPDTVYKQRCFGHLHGATIVPGCRLSVDVDQVGSAETGEDLKIEVRTLQYVRPQDRFGDPQDVGE